MIRAIIFDCFGVLYIKSGEAYYAQFPTQYDTLHDLNQRADYGDVGRQEYIDETSHITGITRAKTEQAFAHEHTLNRPLVEAIEHTLKPSYKIGLLSNMGGEWLQDFFDEHQLRNLFDVVVISSEEGITKPDPLIYLRTAKKLGVSPAECLMIDDAQVNCDGARTAGMQSLLYNARLAVGVLYDYIAREGNKK